MRVFLFATPDIISANTPSAFYIPFMQSVFMFISESSSLDQHLSVCEIQSIIKHHLMLTRVRYYIISVLCLKRTVGVVRLRLRIVCIPQGHRYAVQAEVLHQSWDLDESQLAFVHGLRTLEKNEMRGMYLSYTPQGGGKKVTHTLFIFILTRRGNLQSPVDLSLEKIHLTQ